MPYCKFCGMESAEAAKCTWCGRSLTDTAPPELHSTMDAVEEAEERERGSRKLFFSCCGIVLVVALMLLFWRFPLYPWVMIGAQFAAGILIGTFGIVPPFEDEWWEMGVPLILVIVFPAFFVFIGYLAYGLITREMDLTVVWLLGTYFAMLLGLYLCLIIAAPSAVPASMIWYLRGVEILSLVAVGAGWIASSVFRPLYMSR